MAYKSGWTPFDGLEIKGYIYATLVNGKVKMLDKKIIGKPDGKMVQFYK